MNKNSKGTKFLKALKVLPGKNAVKIVKKKEARQPDLLTNYQKKLMLKTNGLLINNNVT